MKRVVITGMGVISAAGNTPKSLYDAVIDGRSGIKSVQNFDTSTCKVKIGGEASLAEFDDFLSKKERTRLDRTAQMGIFASQRALRDAGLDDGVDRVGIGVFLGTAGGCMQTVENLNSRHAAGEAPDVLGVPMMMTHAPAASISMKFGMQGPCLTISTACSSGAAAIGAAVTSIASGESDWALAGGADASLTRHQITLWGSLRALSCLNEQPAKAVRPFCRTRDGLVLGEGACVLVLESHEGAAARGASIYAEILGVGSSSDAFHVTQPSAPGQVLAIRRSLESARLGANLIDYINAHGTATKYNDKTETQAVKTVMGLDCPPMSSIKPITGHMLGASSALEIAVSALTIKHQILPPTINYVERDPECDLDYVVEGAREARLNHVMTNSFAFGGHNVSVILGRC